MEFPHSFTITEFGKPSSSISVAVDKKDDEFAFTLTYVDGTEKRLLWRDNDADSRRILSTMDPNEARALDALWTALAGPSGHRAAQLRSQFG